MIFKVPSNPNHSMILWFYDSISSIPCFVLLRLSVVGELQANYFGKTYDTCAELLCICLLKASFHEPTLILCIGYPWIHPSHTLHLCTIHKHQQQDMTTVVCKRLKLIWYKLHFSGVSLKIAFLDV